MELPVENSGTASVHEASAIGSLAGLGIGSFCGKPDGEYPGGASPRGGL